MAVKKKIIFCGILFVFLILAAGCETAKGFGKGAATTIGDVGYTMAYTVEGAGKDTYGFWQFLQAADAWIKDNLW